MNVETGSFEIQFVPFLPNLGGDILNLHVQDFTSQAAAYLELEKK